MRVRSVAEVNLDFECREAIEMELQNPTASIFDEAKFVVLDLIKYDLYLKFIDSDIYRNFKGKSPSDIKHKTCMREKDKTYTQMFHLLHSTRHMRMHMWYMRSHAIQVTHHTHTLLPPSLSLRHYQQLVC